MQKIDTVNVSPTRPAFSGAGAPGWFQDTATTGTRLDADWCNDVQGELVGAIEDLGLTPTGGTSQLPTYIGYTGALVSLPAAAGNYTVAGGSPQPLRSRTVISATDSVTTDLAIPSASSLVVLAAVEGFDISAGADVVFGAACGDIGIANAASRFVGALASSDSTGLATWDIDGTRVATIASDRPDISGGAQEGAVIGTVLCEINGARAVALASSAANSAARPLVSGDDAAIVASRIAQATGTLRVTGDRAMIATTLLDEQGDSVTVSGDAAAAGSLYLSNTAINARTIVISGQGSELRAVYLNNTNGAAPTIDVIGNGVLVAAVNGADHGDGFRVSGNGNLVAGIEIVSSAIASNTDAINVAGDANAVVGCRPVSDDGTIRIDGFARANLVAASSTATGSAAGVAIDVTGENNAVLGAQATDLVVSGDKNLCSGQLRSTTIPGDCGQIHADSLGTLPDLPHMRVFGQGQAHFEIPIRNDSLNLAVTGTPYALDIDNSQPLDLLTILQADGQAAVITTRLVIDEGSGNLVTLVAMVGAYRAGGAVTLTTVDYAHRRAFGAATPGNYSVSVVASGNYPLAISKSSSSATVDVSGSVHIDRIA